MSTTPPLLSCLCVTRHKPALLQRAIRCYQLQTYPNKELVIIYETDDAESARVVAALTGPDIWPVAIPHQPKLTLGELRNESIRQCRGEYFCQWDDDDWYHPSRLEIQFNALRRTGNQACALTHWLMFDTRTQQAYCSHRRIWEGSILCHTAIARTTIRYPPYCRGEDNQFIADLYAQYSFCHLSLPMLYVYTYNGQNTWDYDHFDGLFAKGYPLSNWASALVRQILDNPLSNPDALTSDAFIHELETYVYPPLH